MVIMVIIKINHLNPAWPATQTVTSVSAHPVIKFDVPVLQDALLFVNAMIQHVDTTCLGLRLKHIILRNTL